MSDSPASGAGSGTGAAGAGIVGGPRFKKYKTSLKQLTLCVDKLQKARIQRDLPLVKELVKTHSEAVEDFKKAKSKLPEGYLEYFDERDHLLLEYPYIKSNLDKAIISGFCITIDHVLKRISRNSPSSDREERNDDCLYYP